MSQEATGTEFDEDLEPAPAPARTTRKGRGKGRTVVTTRQELIDDDDDSKANMPGLFATSELEENSVVRIRVIRKDPDEGMLGYLDDVNATEDDISQRWGGSQYRVEAINSINRIVAARTFKIAGDPIFVSQTSRIQWEARHRQLGSSSQPAPAGAPPLSLTEIMAFMRENEQSRLQAEEKARSRESQERREHEERMRKIELEAEERRRADERDREERRRRDQERADQQQAQFMANMIGMVKQSAEQSLAFVRQQQSTTPVNPQAGMMDTLKTIVAIKSAFADDKPDSDDGADDPLSLLIKNGDKWLTGLGQAIGGTIREVRGGGQQLPGGVPGQHPALPAMNQQAGGLVIPASSPLAGKLETLVAEIARRGGNPELVLSGVADNLYATLQGARPPHQPAQPADQLPQHPGGPGGGGGPVAPAAPAVPAAPAAPAPEVPHAAGPTNGHARVPVTMRRTEKGSAVISFG